MSPPPIEILLIGVGLATGGATLVGGLLTLRFADRIHLVLGFSAGAVIGVAFLELLPEALRLRPAADAFEVMTVTAAGFLAYLSVDRILVALSGADARRRGHFGAGSLVAHSLLDGLAIGFGFQAAAPVGAAIALAVLAHDLADGVNTVSVSLRGSGDPAVARRWLWADAIAPLIGLAASRLITLPRSGLGVLIALFAGVFLCIGASELVPESHRRYPRAWTMLATIMGVGMIWLVARFSQV